MLKIKYILLSAALTAVLTGCDHAPGMTTVGQDYSVSGSTASFQSFIFSHSYNLGQDSVSNIANLVEKYSQINGVDPKLVLALMAKESSFRSAVVSAAGAIGLGQLMPPTAKDMGVSDPFDPEENVKGTTKYLGWLVKRSNGNIDRALASYNMGPGGVDSVIKSGKALPSDVQKYVSDIKDFYTKV